ncbi:MAG: EamA family transporter [Thermoproteota archaeon]
MLSLALALALYVGVAFALHDSIAKISRIDLPPESITAGTLVWGLAMLALAIPLLGAQLPSARAIVFYLLAGVLNFAVGRSLLYVAIRRLGSSGGSILSSTSAVFGVVAGWSLAGEELRASVVAGSLLIFAASYLASGGLEKLDPLGLLAGLGNGAGIAMGVALARLGNISGGNPVGGVIIAYIAGALSSALATAARGSGGSALRESFGSPPVALMGLLAASGQLSRYLALESLEASVVAPLQNTRPLIATMLLAAFGYRAVRPSARHWIASLMVLAGVYLVASGA